MDILRIKQKSSLKITFLGTGRPEEWTISSPQIRREDAREINAGTPKDKHKLNSLLERAATDKRQINIMDKYILEILKSDPIVFMSWGCNELSKLENGLQFKVNGFKHKGIVQIVYNEGADLFEVILVNEQDNTEIEKITGIYLDELVEVIDHSIEYTGADYNERVDEYLSQPLD